MFGGLSPGMASAGAYNGGLGAVPPAGAEPLVKGSGGEAP